MISSNPVVTQKVSVVPQEDPALNQEGQGDNKLEDATFHEIIGDSKEDS